MSTEKREWDIKRKRQREKKSAIGTRENDWKRD
jgi:hypothetical protein